MASNDQRRNKPKKEGSSGYVYNMPGGGDPYSQEAVKRVIPRGWTYFMRSKAHRERNEQGAKKNVEVQKEVVASSRISSTIEVKSRSSVSSIIEVKSRSSVSQVDNVGSLMRSKTYRECSGQFDEAKGNVEIQKEVITSSRKSVSSIIEVKSRSSVSSIKEVNSRSSVSQMENVRSVAALLNVKVLVSDMPGFMQLHAFRCTRTTYDSLDKFSSKRMAYNVKKEFDKVYGPTWHCIVGSSFGSFVTHATGCFLYFSLEKLYILVFKTKVQKALCS